MGLAVLTMDQSQYALNLVTGAKLIAQRLGGGGRLLARGEGRAGSDARHIAVEFLHPVIVGKPALPARSGPGVVTEADIVIGVAYDGTELTGRVDIALSDRETPQALINLPLPPSPAAAKQRAMLSYHILWEMTHVFLAAPGPPPPADDALASLYPMLPRRQQGGSVSDSTAAADWSDEADEDARQSVLAKLARSEQVRSQALQDNEAAIARAAEIIAVATSVYSFGNGGSATDAEDFAFAVGPRGYALSSDTATTTALANDVGFDVVFARPLATLARRGDAAVGFSTSGTSANVLAGLKSAGGRGLGTVGLAGYEGGSMLHAGLDALLIVSCDSVHRIQEAQVALYSAILERVGGEAVMAERLA